MENIIPLVRLALQENADEKTLQSSRRFFKEEIRPYGVKSATVQKISREHFRLIKEKPKSEIFDLCEILWQSGYLEESFIACNWSHSIHKRYEPADFLTFERWIEQYINNWASCDTFCNHTVGTFIEMYPEYIERLKDFARSGNRWVRRAAAVSLIVPARKGKFLPHIIEIADILLLDQDDMVRKGYGWMLKVASQSDQQAIFEYVIKNKSTMPRTSLRYAIEKMPPEMKKVAMQK